MAEENIKTRDELQDEILKFARSIAEEFPEMAEIMEKSIPRIEKDVMDHFSSGVVSHIRGFVFGGLKFNSSLVPAESVLLIKFIGEHAKIMEESGNAEALHRARELERGFTLGLQYARVKKDFEESQQELMNLGIHAMVRGFDENLIDEDKKLRMKSLEEKVIELAKEQDVVIKELKEFALHEVSYNSRATMLAKEITAAKIRRLNRISATSNDVLEKKNAQEVLAKMKKMLLVEKKQREWNAIQKGCEEYFKANEDQSDEMEEDGQRRVILGIVMTNL